jgi:hypothetical protein
LVGIRVEDGHLQRTDILMDGAVFVHDENVFIFEDGSGWESGGNFYGHGK